MFVYFEYCSLIKLHNNILLRPNQLYKFGLLPLQKLFISTYTFKFNNIMKKTTFICSLGFLFMLMACDVGDYEQNPTINLADTVVAAEQGKPARTDLAFIAQQLATSYSTNFDDTDTTLSQKIVLLDSASLYVPLFISLKPAGFGLPSATEAASFLTGYDYSYTNLNVSLQMKSYLNVLLATDVVDYTTLLAAINTDSSLTTTEKEQLQFIVTYINDTKGDPIEDDSWSKKNIVAAVHGFAKSSANAMFNVALVKVAQ